MFTNQQLKLNPLDLADGDLVFCPVVKFGGPGRLMRSHLLGMLEPAAVLQVNRHAGRPAGVTPDRCQKPRVPRSFADGCPGIVPIQRAPAKRGASLVHALKQRLLVLNTDFGQELIDSFLDLMGNGLPTVLDVQTLPAASRFLPLTDMPVRMIAFALSASLVIRSKYAVSYCSFKEAGCLRFPATEQSRFSTWIVVTIRSVSRWVRPRIPLKNLNDWTRVAF